MPLSNKEICDAADQWNFKLLAKHQVRLDDVPEHRKLNADNDNVLALLLMSATKNLYVGKKECYLIDFIKKHKASANPSYLNSLHCSALSVFAGDLCAEFQADDNNELMDELGVRDIFAQQLTTSIGNILSSLADEGLLYSITDQKSLNSNKESVLHTFQTGFEILADKSGVGIDTLMQPIINAFKNEPLKSNHRLPQVSRSASTSAPSSTSDNAPKPLARSRASSTSKRSKRSEEEEVEVEVEEVEAPLTTPTHTGPLADTLSFYSNGHEAPASMLKGAGTTTKSTLEK